VEGVGGACGAGAEGEGERVEGLGLLGGFLVAVAEFDFLLAEGVEGAGGACLSPLVLDPPELLHRQFLVVSPRLDYFWHQQ
jgi:hypothetical protein